MNWELFFDLWFGCMWLIIAGLLTAEVVGEGKRLSVGLYMLLMFICAGISALYFYSALVMEV